MSIARWVRAALPLLVGASLQAQKQQAAAVPSPAALSAEQQTAYDLLGSQYAREIEQISGWFRDHPVQYFDFGEVRRPVAAVRVLWPVHGFDASGNPVAIRGQRPIFTSVPGIAGYSGVWHLVYVVTADHAQPNQLRDEASVDALVRRRRASLFDPNVLVNLPIVPRGSALAHDTMSTMLGWYAGRDVNFFDFGAVTLSPANMWRFARGQDASGAPNVVREQNSIVDSIPVAGTYPDLWQIQYVQVDSAYTANALKNAGAVRTSGFMVDPVSSIRNLPITMIDGTRIPRVASPVTQFADLRSPFPPAPTRP